MAELDGKYVNEENHLKMKKLFKNIGIAMICVAAVMIAIGIVLVVKGSSLMNGSSMDDPDWFKNSEAGGRWVFGGSSLIIFAVAFIAGGITFIVRAHTRELASFAASSVAPVAADTIKYANKEIVPEIGNTLETITGSVAKSISTAKNGGKACPKCGKANKKTNKFCAYCGTEMNSILHCTECGAELDADAAFCPSCGKKVDR